MSEEKLYAVKNDDGEWLDQDHIFGPGAWAHPNKDQSEVKAKVYSGHVVALVEEPKKVVLSKTDALRQDWLVARYGRYNPHAVSDILAKYKDEAWDMIDAYVNGYTVAKEKKYLVYKVLGGKRDKQNDKGIAQAYRSFAYPGTMFWVLTNEVKYDPNAKLTENEISDFGLQDCEKEEVTDDEQ